MVFIRLTTTKILTLKQENKIKDDVFELVRNLFCQNECAMLHIEDNQVMYCQEGDECIYIECHCDYLYQSEFKQKFCNQLKNIVEKRTGMKINEQCLSCY